MKAQDIRQLTDDELNLKESDLRDELFKLKYQHVSGQLENTSRLKQVRRDIARILNIQNERLIEKG